ncbi:MAG: hypothetical protein HY830_12495 [Actinobacteria bacterium]|nr:hypothetical protein [Actinomycetota bacterium]
MTGVGSTARRVAPVWLAATVVAALATTATAWLAGAAGTSFAVSGKEIPLGAFWFWTVVGALLGLAAALVLRDRRRFVRLGVAGTALSLVPALLAPDDVSSRLALVVAHLVAAAVLVPAVASRLPAGDRTTSAPSVGHLA